jgi:hypothetical protein
LPITASGPFDLQKFGWSGVPNRPTASQDIHGYQCDEAPDAPCTHDAGTMNTQKMLGVEFLLEGVHALAR